MTQGPLRVWAGTAFLVLALIWGDHGAFLDGARALRWALTQPHADTVQTALARYQPARAFVSPTERLGFISDASSYSDWVFEYLVAQYTLAPAVLFRTRAAKYLLPTSVLRSIREAPPPAQILGIFRSRAPADTVWGSATYELVRDFGGGVVLYARRE